MNFVTLYRLGNPVDGVKRPMANGNEGSTPALGDAQARKPLRAPPGATPKDVRDRAILAILIYHGMRHEECALRVRNLQSGQGVVHFSVSGKRGKLRFVPVHAIAQWLTEEYLALVLGSNETENSFKQIGATSQRRRHPMNQEIPGTLHA